MVTDFRNVGRSATPQNAAPSASEAARPELAASRRVIVMTLYCAAAGFLLAGIWLVVGSQTMFPPDIARLMGLAFIISSIGDVIAIYAMKRVWARSVS